MKIQVTISCMLLLLVLSSGELRAEEPTEKTKQDEGASEAQQRLIKLSKNDEVWFDPKRKLVVVDGQIAINDGPLEMFACPKGTGTSLGDTTVQLSRMFEWVSSAPLGLPEVPDV